MGLSQFEKEKQNYDISQLAQLSTDLQHSFSTDKSDVAVYTQTLNFLESRHVTLISENDMREQHYSVFEDSQVRQK